jgi:hypothetical protein
VRGELLRAGTVGALGVVIGALVSASPALAASVRVLRVAGPSEGLAVADGQAYVLRRVGRPYVVRVDLGSGHRHVAFQTSGFPDDHFVSDGHAVGLTVRLPYSGSQPTVTQVVSFDPSGARIVAQASGDGQRDCGDAVQAAGTADSGDVLVDAVSVPCENRAAGVRRLLAINAIGAQRVIEQTPVMRRDDDSAPIAQLEGPWRLGAPGRQFPPGGVAEPYRLTDTRTGEQRSLRRTLKDAYVMDGQLASDGRVILRELLLRRRGGYVQRVRLVRPTDPPSGGLVLGTIGSPPRLNATFCGDQLVVLRTTKRRTRIEVNGHQIARVSTPGDPTFACDNDDLVIKKDFNATRLIVIKLPSAEGQPGR